MLDTEAPRPAGPPRRLHASWCTQGKDQTELNLLIDKAAKAAGSDNKLAISLGVTRQRVSNWRNAHQTCTPADQALMAHIAGLDPVQVLARATVEAYEGKPKGDALMKALGKALLATGGAIGSAGAAAHQIGLMIPTKSVWSFIQCILC